MTEHSKKNGNEFTKEDWTNEMLILNFIRDMSDMLLYYKRNPNDLVDGNFDNGIKDIFVDSAIEKIEQMGVVLDKRGEVKGEVTKVETTGQLADILRHWPRDTGLVIDVSPALEDGIESEYQWHNAIAYIPTSEELNKIHKFGNSFTVIKVDPEIVGC